MSAPSLSPRQQQVLDFIAAHIAEHGHSPTFKEIAFHLGYSSLGATQNLVATLVQRGRLQRLGLSSRYLALPEVTA